jgi:hypothetical protein
MEAPSPNPDVVNEHEPPAPPPDRSLWLAMASTIGGIIQGACAVLVASSSVKGLVSVAALAGALKASKLHSEIVRVPLMVVSVLLSCLTLFVLWNAHRMRNLPSARWRKRPLTGRQWLAILFSLLLSLITLALVVYEVMLHPLFSAA